MKVPDPAKVLAVYDRGLMTRHELVARLVQAAADRPAVEVAALLTPDLLAEVRRETLRPPTRPEDTRFFVGGTHGPSYDPAAHEREMQLPYHAGAWAWHAYFRDRSAE